MSATFPHRHPAPRLPKRLPTRLLAGLLSTLLAGCAAGALTHPPLDTPMPAGYSADNAQWQPAQDWSVQPAGAWWQVFADPELDALQQQLEAHNQSLAAQLAAYDQAQAAVRQAQASYWPALGASLGDTRARTATSAGVNEQASAEVTASWVPDLWGKVREQVRAQRANAQASAATLRNVRLSLQATLAQSYLQLRVVDAQQRLAQQAVDDTGKALELTQNRYRAGVATAADVASARTAHLQAQTSLTDLGVTRAQLQNAIAVLVGQPPSGFQLAARDALPAIPAIPPGLPADLLQRRPDIATSRAQVEAANAQVGVAKSAWFPTLTLGGSAGHSATRLADVFSAPVLLWSLGPQLAANLFDGGARRAQVRSSEAGYRQAVANYRQAVLAALQGVENQLAAQRILATEAEQQAQVVQAAEDALRLAQNQYKAGLAPYLNVLTAQSTAINARNAELTLRNRRYAAAVALVQALGGEWQAPPGTPAAH